MKHLYYNATFYTMNPDAPSASCLITEDDRILAVGDLSELKSQHPDCEEHDLDGGFVFPGFIDTYTAPGIDAYMDACVSEKIATDEIRDWTNDAWEHLYDSGVARLLIHDKYKAAKFLKASEEVAEVPEELFLYNGEFTTAFEEDLYGGYYDDIERSPLNSKLLFDPVYDDADSVHDAIALLTNRAAAGLGLESDLGSLEAGKKADFAVFETNPYEHNMDTFRWIHAMMVVSNGVTVYDAFDQAMSELYDLLSNQTF